MSDDLGQEVRITCAHGSDFRLGLEGRTAIPDDGEPLVRAGELLV